MTAEDGGPPAALSPAIHAASALLDEFVRRGVRDVVLSPGSRSQALALAAADLERREVITLHVRIDERVAGFTALGLSRETGRPTAVVCTSGTAVANLAPAVAEACHAGVPLLLLTADRPPELRGVGANQTTHQAGIFGPWVRFALDAPVPEATDEDGLAAENATFRAIAADAFSAAVGGGARACGPAHLNLPFREPLAGALPGWFALSGAQPVDEAPAPPAGSGALYQGGGGIGVADTPDEVDPDPLVLERGLRTIVVAGADSGPDAEELAHRGGWPLVAEIVSGARFGRHLVHGYRALLRDPALGGRVQRAVVFGRPTLSREVVALLSRPDVRVVAVRGPGERLNLNGETETTDAVAIAPGDPDRAWLGEWMRASADATVDLAPPAPDSHGLSSTDHAERRRAVGAELEAVRRPLDRAGVADAVWRATWPHDRVMFGSSRLVRVADQVLPGKRVPVHANRGVAGIDGTVATAVGIALASQRGGRPGVTRVLLGDLAALHDAGALLLPPSEGEPRIQVIVGNDGGGTIFDGLEVATAAGQADLDRVMYTPHEVGFEHLALAYGWQYHRVTTRAALDQLLTAPVVGRQLIEVPLPR